MDPKNPINSLLPEGSDMRCILVDHFFKSVFS